MNFNFLLTIKFNELYIFMSENIKQKHVFNVINISFSITSDLNCLMTVTQCFKLTAKLFLKFLISLMILIKINNMKTLMKTMKTMIFIMIITVFLKSLSNFVFMIFFSFENDVIYVSFFYDSLNSADDCFNASNINLYCDCKLDFRSVLILLCNRLLQASVW